MGFENPFVKSINERIQYTDLSVQFCSYIYISMGVLLKLFFSVAWSQPLLLELSVSDSYFCTWVHGWCKNLVDEDSAFVCWVALIATLAPCYEHQWEVMNAMPPQTSAAIAAMARPLHLTVLFTARWVSFVCFPAHARLGSHEANHVQLGAQLMKNLFLRKHFYISFFAASFFGEEPPQRYKQSCFLCICSVLILQL